MCFATAWSFPTSSRPIPPLFTDLHHGVTACEDELTGKIREGVGVSTEIRVGAKVCSGIVMILLVIGALGPENWTPRTALGWRFDHFIGYFAITLFICFAWPRPFMVGGVLVAAAFLLEGLQAFTPDRTANLVAALCGAAGVLAAALVAELFIRAWRWHLKSARDTKVAGP
jgi:VanZ family protein